MLLDDQSILNEISVIDNYPIGVGGCHNNGKSFDSCEFNVTVFDGKKLPDKIIPKNGSFIKITHASLDDDTSGSDVLVNYDSMRVIHDPLWELQSLISKITHKRKKIFLDYAKNCILNSIFCCTKASNGIDSDVFASCWQKSALVYLTHSILSLNYQRPSPSHNLEKLRGFTKNFITNKISVIHDTLGIERATPSLLDRMCKSTIGFSQKIEKNQHSLIIQAKHDYFVKNSMLADCYFYLTCINHTNFISLKNTIHRNPDLIYILKTAFDLENNPEKLRHDTDIIHKTCDELLSNLNTT